MNFARRSIPEPTLVSGVLLAVFVAGCSWTDAGERDAVVSSHLRVLALEDARVADSEGRDSLLAGLHSPSEVDRLLTVRALGRLEDPSVSSAIADLLTDSVAGVRAEAVNALAQSVHGRDGTAVLDDLLGRVENERDTEALGVLARSLGRLRVDVDRRSEVVEALITLSRSPASEFAPPETLVGVAVGIQHLLRRAGPDFDPDGTLVDRLREMVRHEPMESTPGAEGPRIRALSLDALARIGSLPALILEPALRDPDPRVRYVASGALEQLPRAEQDEFLRRALRDPSPATRLAATRVVDRGARDDLACRRLLSLTEFDETPRIRVAALDALARPCPDVDIQTERLKAVAATLPAGGEEGWHEPVHALVSLAGIDAPAAGEFLPRFAGHPNPFVRTYAARAATVLGDEATLRALAGDPSANVRTVTVEGLVALLGHGADEILLAQLAVGEPQSTLTAARLLSGTADPGASMAPAVDALRRLTERRRETLRDPRLALLALIAEVGSAADTDVLLPYLTDFDPAVAERAASILTEWTGEPHAADPHPLPRLPLPTAREFSRLMRSSVVLHMESGSEIEIRLRPEWAATNAHRFARLVEEGYFDGLTFHRVEPLFVIQGGSPDANEYSGDGPFTRDELGLPSHWRGTVGLSTRGRDTGDGQIFVNLVDNVRLDHDYTLFGEVVSSMKVVDDVMEGDRIIRGEVRLRD